MRASPEERLSRRPVDADGMAGDAFPILPESPLTLFLAAAHGQRSAARRLWVPSLTAVVIWRYGLWLMSPRAGHARNIGRHVFAHRDEPCCHRGRSRR